MPSNFFSIEIILILYLVISIGSAAQVSTGIGLGLFAGPVLLLCLPVSSAILITICLNILISFPLALLEKNDISWSSSKYLSAGIIIGIPFGWLSIQFLSTEILQLLIASVILFVIYLIKKRNTSYSGQLKKIRNPHPSLVAESQVS